MLTTAGNNCEPVNVSGSRLVPSSNCVVVSRTRPGRAIRATPKTFNATKDTETEALNRRKRRQQRVKDLRLTQRMAGLTSVSSVSSCSKRLSSRGRFEIGTNILEARLSLYRISPKRVAALLDPSASLASLGVVGDNQRHGEQSAVNPNTLSDDVHPVHRSGYVIALKRSQSLKRDRPSEDNPDSAKTYGFRGNACSEGIRNMVFISSVAERTPDDMGG